MLTLPLGLKHAIESGNCVLFLGAGIGHHLKDSNGDPAPNAPELAMELANHFNIDTITPDLAKVAQAIVNRQQSRADLENYVKQRLTNLEPDDSLVWLFT